MKNIKLIIVFAFFTIGLFYSCSENQLDVKNPNDPTLDALNTESGITQLATGVYNNDIAVGDNNYIFYWIVMANHENMGDVIYTPWGNWSWRWVNQPSSITLDNGTQVLPPQEGAQGVALETRNSRTQGDANAFAHEWMTMYNTNNTANLILSLVDDTKFQLDADNKRASLKAWAYFWKAYAYTRIGSMYTSGLIISEPNATNGNFVTNTEIINEATKNFDLAIAELNKTTGDISSFMASVIPAHLVASSFRGNNPSASLTKDMWIRNINTLKARNIMVNKKVSSMTAADWTAVQTLANAGMQAGDFIFVMKQDGNNFITSTIVPHRLLIGWHFLSERLVQDFKAGDKRFADNVTLLGSPEVNRSGRGIQYGTRYGFKDADYATTADKKANVYYGATFDENQLIKAEAAIYLNNIEPGLALIDGVRTYQQATLASVAGTGLTRAQALEELRKERRIGLLLRGVGFYDARRWDVTKTPRSGATVLSATGVVNTNATINYNYLDYWSVPDQELSFNSPSSSSAPVKSLN